MRDFIADGQKKPFSFRENGTLLKTTFRAGRNSYHWTRSRRFRCLLLFRLDVISMCSSRLLPVRCTLLSSLHKRSFSFTDIPLKNLAPCSFTLTYSAKCRATVKLEMKRQEFDPKTNTHQMMQGTESSSTPPDVLDRPAQVFRPGIVKHVAYPRAEGDVNSTMR